MFLLFAENLFNDFQFDEMVLRRTPKNVALALNLKWEKISSAWLPNLKPVLSFIYIFGSHATDEKSHSIMKYSANECVTFGISRTGVGISWNAKRHTRTHMMIASNKNNETLMITLQWIWRVKCIRREAKIQASDRESLVNGFEQNVLCKEWSIWFVARWWIYGFFCLCREKGSEICVYLNGRTHMNERFCRFQTAFVIIWTMHEDGIFGQHERQTLHVIF